MKPRTPNRLSKQVVFFAFLCMAFATTVAHDWFVDSRFQEINKNLHAQVITGTAPAPIQYRILMYYAAEGLVRAGMAFNDAYFVLRFAFTFLCAIALYAFLSLWFVPVVSFAGVAYLFACLPLTYIRYYMQPMDMPNLLVFILGFLLIIKRKDLLLFPLIVIGMLNRETAILLVLVYLFVRWDEMKPARLAMFTGALFAAGMGTYALLRRVFEIKHYYSDLYYLGFNVTDVRTYLYAIAMFGPFLFLAFHKLSEKPKFLRRALLLFPFFVIIHYTMTVMVEPRLWLPLVPLIVAAGLWAVVPEELKAAVPDSGTPPKNPLAKYSSLAYAALMMAFLAFFVVFFRSYKDMHLKDRELQNQVDAILAESRVYAGAGQYAFAEEQLKKALVYSPGNENIHYDLAVLYAYNLHDTGKALIHFKRCLEINPNHLYSQRIKNEIDRLTYYAEKSRSEARP